MTALIWHVPEQKTFEAGVDKGVLYLSGRPGVAWNGLVSVTEKNSGGSSTPHYLDGFAYYIHTGNQEYRATVEAYTYPDQFLECEGIISGENGLFVTNQARRSFGLCYRTMVGNEVEGLNLGYRINLVYNAIVDPSEKERSSISNQLEPLTFSWDIVTKTPRFIGFKPTSHFIIDSRKTPDALLSDIEDILYGTDTTEPRLPSIEELMFMFLEYESESFDAGTLTEQYFATIDAGEVTDPYTTTIDGGVP